MLKALALKELRETAWLGGIAAALLFYLGVYETGFNLLWMERIVWPGRIPLVSDHFVNGPSFTFIGVLLALALGFRQSAWESMRGTYPFLLHRPISRRRLFAIKLLVGIVVQLVVTGLAVLLFALWAATPGTHASPFRWSMTTWEWLLCLSMIIVYLGAFLSGIREARWFGSRILPLLAAVAIMVIVAEMPIPAWCRFLLLVVATLLYVAAILHVVRTRDYA